MVLNVTETITDVYYGRGEGGEEGMEVGKEIDISLHCHHYHSPDIILCG